MDQQTYVIRSSLPEVDRLSKEIKVGWDKAGLDKDTVFALYTALEEALVNAVKHGNKFDPGLSVEVRVGRQAGEVRVEVKDQGKGFDHTSIPDPRRHDVITKLSGKGVFMIKELMDEVSYLEGGTRIVMVKKIEPHTV